MKSLHRTTSNPHPIRKVSKVRLVSSLRLGTTSKLGAPAGLSSSDSDNSIDTTSEIRWPIPENPGLKSLYYFDDDMYQHDALEIYKKECLKYGLTPVRAVVDIISGESDKEYKLNLKDFRPRSLDIYFFCKALTGPPVAAVTLVNLTNAFFDEIGCIGLSEFMQQSSVLVHVNLSNCRIGYKGAMVLLDGIQLSVSLKYLNMSGCNLGDLGGEIIIQLITHNEVLKYLDLSNNQLHRLTAVKLVTMLKQNKTLEVLVLKWNLLFDYMDCSTNIAQGLRFNESLRRLDLEWNGISGKPFTNNLVKALRIHPSLQILNLANNRLSSEEVKGIATAISNAIVLQRIYLGNNLWYGNSTYDLIKAAIACSTLKILDLGLHIWLPEESYNLAQIAMSTRPSLQIIFKGKLLPNPPESVDFQELVVRRARYSAMAPKIRTKRRDLGHFMINALSNDNNSYVSTESFMNDITAFKAKLDDDLIKHLADVFTEKVEDGTKTIKKVALKKMAEYYLEKYPTKAPPPPKKKKKELEKKIKNKVSPQY